MKILSILFLLASGLSTNGQTNNPFLQLTFDKVIMYDFDGGAGKSTSIVEENGQLNKTISKQVLLDKSTIDKLNVLLGDKKSFGGPTADCFDPHLGFVYYLKNKIVGHITICMACNNLHSSIDIAGQKQGKVGSGINAYYIVEGMNKPFREFLNNLLKTNNFSHQAF